MRNWKAIEANHHNIDMTNRSLDLVVSSEEWIEAIKHLARK